MTKVAFRRQAFRVLPPSVLHFAAKRDALCGKTQCIMPQNGARFAAKYNPVLPQNTTPFCRKTPHGNVGLRQKDNKKGTKATFFWEKVQNLKELSYICTFFRLHAKQWQL